MSDQKAQGKALARPAAVTVSSGLIMIGAFLVVVLAFSGISELHSIATRKAVDGRTQGLAAEFAEPQPR